MLPSLTAVVTAVAIISSAHVLFVPAPDHAAHPWLESATYALDRVQRICMSAADMTGLVSEVTIRRLFSYLTTMYSPLAEGVEETRLTISDVEVIQYSPRSLKGQGHPALIYIHGGGWVSGSADTHRSLTSRFSSEGQLIVFSINYRLAPEHVFPAAHDDCLRVTSAILDQAEVYNLDRNRVGIAGDEVGGTLALSVSLSLLDTPRLPDPCITGVFYAPLQVVDFLLPSYVTYGTGPASLQRNDVIDNTMYYIYGEKRSDVKEHMIKNLQTAPMFWEMDLSRRIHIDFLPFSFRSARPKDIPRDGGNVTLVNKLEKLVLDPRLSPMFASEKKLPRLRYLYFINPDIDPVRDESLMLYEVIREIDMMRLLHDYYRTESHGFLRNFRFNDVANDAIMKFVVKLNQVCQEISQQSSNKVDGKS